MSYIKAGIRGLIIVPIATALCLACMAALFADWVFTE